MKLRKTHVYSFFFWFVLAAILNKVAGPEWTLAVGVGLMAAVGAEVRIR